MKNCEVLSVLVYGKLSRSPALLVREAVKPSELSHDPSYKLQKLDASGFMGRGQVS